MIEVGPNLFHASGPRPEAISADLVAITVVRDEMWRLPFFLAYHRWLGVQHFIVIDHRSKDGTSDFLGREPDVTCIQSTGEYGGRPMGHHGWLRWAVQLGPPERWSLIVDADELFVGRALTEGHLLALTRELSSEGAAIAATSMVDCYPGEFPFAAWHFEPVPWQRAPHFDAGPYFRWPASGSQLRYFYCGARERLCWPHWRWARVMRKVVPRPIRPGYLQDAPPLAMKMPLIRNLPGLKFSTAHVSSGAPRSRQLFSLLHYKLDIDLPAKVEVALRERQHWNNSRDYAAYARIFATPRFDLRFPGTRRFEGVRSLVDAGLADFDKTDGKSADRSHPPLSEIAEQIWRYGDQALQKQVWENTWGSQTAHAA